MLLDDDSKQSLVDLGFKDGQPLLIESESNVYNKHCCYLVYYEFILL